MNKYKFPAGTYYVGDLCYVMHEEWDEMFNLFFPEFTSPGNEGKFQLKSGVTFGCFTTAYGDGVYTDQKGRNYPVDSGSIGLVRVEDVDIANKENDLALGQILAFDEDFEIFSTEDHTLHFGNVAIIPTKDEFYEEECYE